MNEELEIFVQKIPNFKELSSSGAIPYFIYFLTLEKKWTNVAEITSCFTDLSMKPYSNIFAYISAKSRSKTPTIIKNKNGIELERNLKATIADQLSESVLKPSSGLVDLSIFQDTPYYIKKIAEQMCLCYDIKLFDACLVMLRRLMETLIVECFERHGIAEQIKDSNGHFFYLSDLIPKLLNSDYWIASRNVETNIKAVKKYGDLSAHNRRFIAKKSDIDAFRFELRQAIQEIILIIDYPTWSKQGKVHNNIA